MVRSFVVAVPKELLPLLLFVCSLLNLFDLSSGFILVNVAANEQPSKKPKLEELPAAPSNEQIFEFVEKCSEKNWTKKDQADFCYPRMIPETWKREVLNQMFRGKQQVVLESVQKEVDDTRAPLVITVVAGYGNGKTHFLQAAPGFVGQESIFVTYNQDQDLRRDKSEPRKALLLRIILGTYGTGSFGAANFLASRDGLKIIDELDEDKLLEIAAERLAKRFASGTGFLICVDEVRKLEKLNVGATSALLSVLGALARTVYRLPTKLQCTAVVSALDNDGIAIYTESGRTVADLKLPDMDRSAIDLICRVLQLPEEQRWKVVAVAGSHFRSAVASVDVLQEGNSHVDIERLVKLLFDRLRQTLTDDSIVAIEDYIKAMMKEGGNHARVPPMVKSNCSTDGAIPPALICVTCERNSALRKLGADKHALGIFHNDIANAAFDQLELSAMHFDLLRSVWELPVVPSSMTVTGGEAWYADLRFRRQLKSSGTGILQMKAKKVVWNGLEPVVGVYYHPGLANHPWIDRFFMADTKNGKKCLVLYQDKINAAGFPNAVEDLNLAAKILTKKLKVEVLCIANVIDASGQTRSQSNFEYPYLLVRDSELDEFYTTNFAPAMRFLRTRFRDQGAKTKPSNS